MNLKRLGLASLLVASSLLNISSINHQTKSSMIREYILPFSSEIFNQEIIEENTEKITIKYYRNPETKTVWIKDFPLTDWEIKIKESNKPKTEKDISIVYPESAERELEEKFRIGKVQRKIKNNAWLEDNGYVWINENHLQIMGYPRMEFDIYLIDKNNDSIPDEINVSFYPFLLIEINRLYNEVINQEKSKR